jgi:hypothetical protein
MADGRGETGNGAIPQPGRHRPADSYFPRVTVTLRGIASRWANALR